MCFHPPEPFKVHVIYNISCLILKLIYDTVYHNGYVHGLHIQSILGAGAFPLLPGHTEGLHFSAAFQVGVAM